MAFPFIASPDALPTVTDALADPDLATARGGVANRTWSNRVRADSENRGGPHLCFVVIVRQAHKIFSGRVDGESRVSSRVLGRDHIVLVLDVFTIGVVFGDHKGHAGAGRHLWERIDNVDVAQRALRTERLRRINARRGFDRVNAEVRFSDLQVFTGFQFVLRARGRTNQERNAGSENEETKASG